MLRRMMCSICELQLNPSCTQQKNDGKSILMLNAEIKQLEQFLQQKLRDGLRGVHQYNRTKH
jgi:hypothetical protein